MTTLILGTMALSEIDKLLSFLGNFSFGLIIGGAIIYLFIRFFLPSYFSEKAKNLATKEDIESITDKVESVRADYSHLLEEVRSNHQLKLAAIEREKNIKKEVYMAAVEAITRSQNMIMDFSNLDQDADKITSNMKLDAGKIAKIQVVGGKETVKSVTKYMTEIARAALDLMLRRSELIMRKNDINTNESMRDNAQKEIDRFVEMMKNMNLQGNTDKHLWDTVNKNVEFQQDQYDKYQAEIDALDKVQNKEHLEFTRECMDRYVEISKIIPPVVLAVREELDLEISSEDYLDIYNENIEESRNMLNKFLDRIDEKFS